MIVRNIKIFDDELDSVKPELQALENALDKLRTDRAKVELAAKAERERIKKQADDRRQAKFLLRQQEAAAKAAGPRKLRKSGVGRIIDLTIVKHYELDPAGSARYTKFSSQMIDVDRNIAKYTEPEVVEALADIGLTVVGAPPDYRNMAITGLRPKPEPPAAPAAPVGDGT